MARLINAPFTFWLLLSLPAIVWVWQYQAEKIFYGEFLHTSGDFAVQLLIATLAVSPLRLLFPKTKLIRWFVQRRRYLGVAAFAYALLHTLVYLQRKADFSLILAEALEVGIGTGWIGLAILLLLALSSNNFSVRVLRRRWQRLHNFVYVSAILVFAHWILTAFDPKIAYVHLSILIAFILLRLFGKYILKR